MDASEEHKTLLHIYISTKANQNFFWTIFYFPRDIKIVHYQTKQKQTKKANNSPEQNPKPNK